MDVTLQSLGKVLIPAPWELAILFRTIFLNRRGGKGPLEKTPAFRLFYTFCRKLFFSSFTESFKTKRGNLSNLPWKR